MTGIEKTVKKDVKVQSYISKAKGAEGAKVTVYGEPNIDVWAKKIVQIYEDIQAGKYSDNKEEEAV
jgi:hypothetical protein